MTLTPRDLIELASLDVLGLLDEDERRDFEQALRVSSPEIQAQVRREQLRIASSEAYLPSVETPPGLKLRVMDAVRDAIEAVRAGETREHVRRTLGPFAVRLQRNVSPLWRAASIGFAAATVLLGYFTMRVKENYEEISANLAADQSIAAISEAYSPRIVDLLTDHSVPRITFARGPGAAAATPAAALLIDEREDKSYLLYNNLPVVEGGYRLVAVKDGQVTQVLHRFEAHPGREQTIINFALKAGVSLAILPETANNNLAAAVLVAGVV